MASIRGFRFAAVSFLLLWREEGVAQVSGALGPVLGLGHFLGGQGRGDLVQGGHGLAHRALVSALPGQLDVRGGALFSAVGAGWTAAGRFWSPLAV